MFYALATRKIDTGDINYVHLLSDIETLNRKALKGEYEVSAISIHAYAYMADKYALMSCGASMGRNYGPIVISGKPLSPKALDGKVVAIPGEMTTAWLALQLFEPGVKFEVVPFDRILEEVQKGRYEAGLLIHEGQLFYHSLGLHKVLDLGEWWHEHTGGLPLPMGGNAIRRELGEETIREVSDLLRESIQYSLDNREDALAYAMQFARDMDPNLADRFVAMWVNELTLDYTDRGREAVRRLLTEGYERGIIPNKVDVQFVG